MFSVLLSVYYKESPLFLGQCIDSLLCQTKLPGEIVLVKDGPLTESLNDVIDEYLKITSIIKVVELSANQGLGNALNAGMEFCTFSLIARMDTDDIAKSNRFERQLDIFEKYSEIDVVGAWIDEFEGDVSHVISTRKLPKWHDEIAHFAKLRNPINHPVVMFKKEAVLAAGGYQHFPFFEDYYLWIRMLLNGAKFYNIQESLLFFRFSSDLFERRGGWKYAMHELSFLGALRSLGFLSLTEYVRNVFVRFLVRIIPNNIRTKMYVKLFRKTN